MAQYYHDFSSLEQSIDIIKDKKRAAKNEATYMLMRLQEMFEYEGLPGTIPKDYLEYYRMINGQCFITEVNGSLYALCGNPGGEPDPYYRPTIYVVANPALRFSAELDIVKDGCLMRNDWGWFGLAPMLSKYSVMLAENFLTIRTADVILRAMALISAPDDKTFQAAQLFLKKLEQGELGAIGESPFFEGIRLQSPPSNNGSYLTQFIELQQYLRGALFQELGIDALSNMKRESLSEGETHLNEGTLLPLVDHMLRVREEDNERLNAMYGLNVKVRLSSAWKMLRQQITAANELAKDEEIEKNTANELAENEVNEDEKNTDDEILDEQIEIREGEDKEEISSGSDSETKDVNVRETGSNEETIDKLVETVDKALELANSLVPITDKDIEQANELADIIDRANGLTDDSEKEEEND